MQQSNRRNFPQERFYLADYNDFDALIVEELGIPGFEAQRVYEWPNDSQVRCTGDIDALDEDPREHVEHFSQFVADHWEQAIQESEERTYPWYTTDEAINKTFILDRILMLYLAARFTVPAIDEFLVVLSERGFIPIGNYLIELCW